MKTPANCCSTTAAVAAAAAATAAAAVAADSSAVPAADAAASTGAGSVASFVFAAGDLLDGGIESVMQSNANIPAQWLHIRTCPVQHPAES